jgi:hypothetical protein
MAPVDSKQQRPGELPFRMAQMANSQDYLAPRPTVHPNPKEVEQPEVGRQPQDSEPRERHSHPCQRAYGEFRNRILTTLIKRKRNRIINGFRLAVRSGFLMLDAPARWLMDLFDTVSGVRGYLAVGSVRAAYLAVYGVIDAKSTQEETRASVERSLFITLVSSNNAASFVAAMKEFGSIQVMPATEHPSLFPFWEWGRTYQPNREPMLRWAQERLGWCNKSAKDCSLKDDTRLASRGLAPRAGMR